MVQNETRKYIRHLKKKKFFLYCTFFLVHATRHKVVYWILVKMIRWNAVFALVYIYSFISRDKKAKNRWLELTMAINFKWKSIFLHAICRPLLCRFHYYWIKEIETTVNGKCISISLIRTDKLFQTNTLLHGFLYEWNVRVCVNIFEFVKL